MASKTTYENRRTINVNEELAERLNLVANQEGKTLYSLVNKVVEVALEALDRGYELEDLLEAIILLDKAKSSSLLLVNQDLWYEASAQAHKVDGDRWTKKVHQIYEHYAQAALSHSSEQDFIDSLTNYLSKYFFDCKDVEVETNLDGSWTMKGVFTPHMPTDHVKTIFKALEGMLNAFSYVVLKYRIHRGVVSLVFRKVSSRDS